MDDTIRPGVTAESLAGLKSVFPNWGNASTTAGNASGVGDGAAICVLTTRANAEKEGMDIIGKYVTSTVVSVEPKYMGISPAVAIPKVLEMTGLSKEDIDVYEVCISFGFVIIQMVTKHYDRRSTKPLLPSLPTVWKSSVSLLKRSTPMVAPLL